jgi:hypothetical protein
LIANRASCPVLEICEMPGGEPYSPPISAETSESRAPSGRGNVRKEAWLAASKTTQVIKITDKTGQVANRPKGVGATPTPTL